MNILKIFVLLLIFTQAKGTERNAPANKSSVTSSTTSTENSTDQVTTSLYTVNTTGTFNQTMGGNQSTGRKPTLTGGDHAVSTQKGPMTRNLDELLPHPYNFFNWDLKMILTFLLGVISTTIIFSSVLCCTLICRRCRGTDANQDKESIILEAVKHDQTMMQSDEDQAGKQALLQVQSASELSGNTSAVYTGNEEELKKQTSEAGEVNYASINYSLLQKKDENLFPAKIESDYAEIQVNETSEGEEAGEKQQEVKQDEVDQDLREGMESQDQVELDEVQV